MKTIKKIWGWIDDRSGFTEIFMPLIKHPVPPGSKWSYVFGSATLFCLVLQVITGVALSLLYQPSSSEAYQSLQFITHKAAFGNLLRGIHYFGASGMIIMVSIHMIRVYITAAYKYPREMTWISGVLLFFMTIAMGFTGQLLRWDSNGVWSSVVAAEQLGRIPFIGKWAARLLLGGDTIGGHSLSRFYSYHVFIIPAIIFLFVGYHLMLVIRNGISEPAKVGRLVDPKTYRQWYKTNAVGKRHPLLALCRMARCDIRRFNYYYHYFTGYFHRPAGTDHTTKSNVPQHHTVARLVHAIFSLFALMPPKIESYMIIIGPAISIIVLLAMPFISNKGERHPIRRPWAVFGSLCVIIFVFTLFLLGEKSPWSPRFDTKPLTAATIRSKNPVIINGAALFYKKGCLYCHRIDGQGGLKGPDLSEAALRLSTSDITIRMVNGGNNMPAYGGILSKNEITAIAAFLSSRKGK